MELDNVTIKVPCTVEGLRACRQLRDLGATVNVTLIFSAAQACLLLRLVQLTFLLLSVVLLTMVLMVLN